MTKMYSATARPPANTHVQGTTNRHAEGKWSNCLQEQAFLQDRVKGVLVSGVFPDGYILHFQRQTFRWKRTKHDQAALFHHCQLHDTLHRSVAKNRWTPAGCLLDFLGIRVLLPKCSTPHDAKTFAISTCYLDPFRRNICACIESRPVDAKINIESADRGGHPHRVPCSP